MWALDQKGALLLAPQLSIIDMRCHDRPTTAEAFEDLVRQAGQLERMSLSTAKRQFRKSAPPATPIAHTPS
jgi:hypothetical protein